MIRALWTASSGMMAQQANIDNISNNLANVNTVGFKKSRVDFQDVMYQTLKNPSTQNPIGIQMGHGSRYVATQKLFTQGDMQQTDNPLDFMIEGDGFFEVQLPDGTTAYTRDGGFKLDAQGRMITSDGYLVLPEVTVPENAETSTLAVDNDGTITVKIAGNTEAQEIGRLQLARFRNPAGLNSLGRNLYSPTTASGPAIETNPGIDGMGNIVQRYIEMSNVKVVEEMVNMIVAQRAYEVNSKAIQAADDMLNTANQLRR